MATPSPFSIVATNTPRRSPRLAAARHPVRSDDHRLIPVVRKSLRKFVLRDSQSSSDSHVVDDIKQLVEETGSSVNLEIVTAEVSCNELKQFLVITRSIKSYDTQIGPYDAAKLVVQLDDASYRLLVYDECIEEGIVKSLSSLSCLQQAVNKVAEWIVCQGIKEYSTYKTSIGYDLKSVVILNCPPDSSRDSECALLFKRLSSHSSLVCKKCSSLKWKLSKLKKEHDQMTDTCRKERQSVGSKLPFDYLSPNSKRRRLDNMRKAIHTLKSKVVYHFEKIQRISANEVQNKELGELVDAITTSSEAGSTQEGVEHALKGIWENDVSDWRQFKIDQEQNSKCLYNCNYYCFYKKIILCIIIIVTSRSSNRWSTVTIRLGQYISG